MVIFHSYVSLPEGTDWTIQILLGTWRPGTKRGEHGDKGTWGELDGSETCGELWGGLNWFRLRLGREDFANAFTIIYLTNPIQCTYATLQLQICTDSTIAADLLGAQSPHGLSAFFRLSPFPSTSGASTRAAKAFEAFKRGKSEAIASPD